MTQGGADEKKKHTVRKTHSNKKTRRERLGVTRHTTLITGMRTTVRMRDGGGETGNPQQRRDYRNLF